MASRRVRVTIHLESACVDGGPSEVVWWAESNDMPDFSAAADSLSELRSLFVIELRERFGPKARWSEQVAADTEPVLTAAELVAA